MKTFVDGRVEAHFQAAPDHPPVWILRDGGKAARLHRKQGLAKAMIDFD
jgi:hypothetical protein